MRPYIFLPLPMTPSYRGIFFLQAFVWPPPLTPNSFLLSRDVTVKNVSIYAPWPAILYTESVKKGPFSTRKRERNLSQKKERENKSVTKYVCREETGRGRNPCVISYLSLSLFCSLKVVMIVVGPSIGFGYCLLRPATLSCLIGLINGARERNGHGLRDQLR